MVLLLTATLVFSSVGSFVFQDPIVAEAKKYKSGKKGFNTNTNKNNTNSNIQKDKEDSTPAASKTNNTTNNTKGGFFSGGLMKGLFVGGLAGLLFGSLFANMGMLGSILGFMINAGAIILIIVLVKKIFDMMKRKQKEDKQAWKN